MVRMSFAENKRFLYLPESLLEAIRNAHIPALIIVEAAKRAIIPGVQEDTVVA